MYSGNIVYDDLESMEALDVGLNHLKDEKVIRKVDFWWSDMKKYTDEKTNFTSWHQFANPSDFPMVLSDFLFSSHGAKFKPNFKFDSELTCNQPAPNITATKFNIGYFHMKGPEDHIPARRSVTKVINEAGSPFTFSHSKVYAAWETDEIIGFELWRNIGLAMACVFVITLLLLTNLQICLMVILIVVITLADIIGFLHFWDITIDIISCVNIVLAIGLCVDYSVHVGHAYLVATGSRSEKAQEAMRTIGPAVFNGGFTTFLALVLLGASSSHVFISFFKVFVLTVTFGLFHGLILFPIILSTLGPVDTIEDTPDDISNNDQSVLATVGISMVGTASQVQHFNDGLVNQTFVPDNGHKPDILDQPWLQKHSPRSGRHS